MFQIVRVGKCDFNDAKSLFYIVKPPWTFEVSTARLKAV